MTSQTPSEITTAFLDALARRDVNGAVAQVHDDIQYTNVSLPTIRGRRKVAKVIKGLDKPSIGFNYRYLNIAEDGATVLTERIDELRFGPVVIQFWVWGRFEIRDAQIVVWRDYFDYFDMTKGLLRGLAAVVVPAFQKPLPAPA
ncbi:limonene-1,2-epoxide hydrolase family protein [Gordonia soli]|nr:limonene-1,2-epoxide hydrolase family protein [Gordonia soli]